MKDGTTQNCMADLPQKGTKLVYWNVRSMWNKLDIIKQHISSSTPQFYGLSETWLKPNIPDNLINILSIFGSSFRQAVDGGTCEFTTFQK